MSDNFTKPETAWAPDPRVLANLKASVTLTLESDRLFREYPLSLPTRVQSELQQLVHAELAMRRLEKAWPPDPRPSPEVLGQIRRQVSQPAGPGRQPAPISARSYPAPSRPARTRRIFWAGGMALAASLAFVFFLFHPPQQLPARNAPMPLASLVDVELWMDPELADISTQLNLVEVDSAVRRQSSNLEKLLVPDSLTSELESLENTSLWEESL